MGEIAKRLHRKLASKSHHLPTKAPRRRPGDPLPGGVKDISTLINESCVPPHAVYAFIQQMTSQFAEAVAHWPEMKAWGRVVERAEEEYIIRFRELITDKQLLCHCTSGYVGKNCTFW